MYLVSLYLFPPFQEMEETALLQCVCVFMSNFVYTTFTIISYSNFSCHDNKYDLNFSLLIFY